MDNHIAMEQFSSDGTATMYYFITDKRGNIEALMDDTGTVLERYHHTVYGTETTVYNADYTGRDCEKTDTCYFGAAHTFGWSGSTFEPETDLYWMRNRYYHPDMKRFINQDPIGIWGGANNLGNGFAYVAGMVVDHWDPTGLINEEAFFEPSGVSLGQNNNVMTETAKYFTGVTMIGGTMGGLGGKLLSTVKIGGPVIGIGVLFIWNMMRVSATQTTAIESGNKFHKNDLAQAHGINSESAITTADFTDTGDLRVTTTGEDEDGNKVTITTVYDSNGKVKSSKKVVEDEEGNKTYWVWDPNKNGKGKGGWVKVDAGLSVDEDSMDKMQTFFAKQLLKKMLKQKELTDEDRSEMLFGPPIYNDPDIKTGPGSFMFNPLYKSKDPMKQIFTERTDTGMTIQHNPLAPKPGFAPGYKSWAGGFVLGENRVIIMPEVDPYFE